MYIYMCIYTYVYIYVYIYMYTNIFLHIHLLLHDVHTHVHWQSPQMDPARMSLSLCSRYTSKARLGSFSELLCTGWSNLRSKAMASHSTKQRYSTCWASSLSIPTLINTASGTTARRLSRWGCRCFGHTHTHTHSLSLSHTHTHAHTQWANSPALALRLNEARLFSTYPSVVTWNVQMKPKGAVASPNLEQAAKWHEMAANQGVLASAYAIAVAKETGSGIDANLQDSFAWYRIAATGQLGDGEGSISGVEYVCPHCLTWNPNRRTKHTPKGNNRCCQCKEERYFPKDLGVHIDIFICTYCWGVYVRFWCIYVYIYAGILQRTSWYIWIYSRIIEVYMFKYLYLHILLRWICMFCVYTYLYAHT